MNKQICHAIIIGALLVSSILQAAPHVSKIDFKATQFQTTASCPSKVKFTGSITSTGPGKVQYRVLFPGGAKTSIRTLQFAKTGSMKINNIEYTASQSMPVATATLEILSRNAKKAYAKFKVNCIAANGPKSITNIPSENTGGATGQSRRRGAVVVEGIQ